MRRKYSVLLTKGWDDMVLEKISVIVPVYNEINNIEKCVSGLVAQTYPEKEIILVDDGSTDGSGDLCDRLAEEYYEVRSVRKERCTGVSDTRNCGIKAAEGEFLVFVDADDEVDVELLYLLRENYTDNSMTVGSLLQKYSDGREICRMWSDTEEVSSVPASKFMQVSEKISGFFSPVCKIFRKDIIWKNKILFDRSFTNGEDRLFVLEYLVHTNKLRLVNKPLYIYNLPAQRRARYNDSRQFDQLLEMHRSALAALGARRDYPIVLSQMAEMFLDNLWGVELCERSFSRKLKVVRKLFKSRTYREIKKGLYKRAQLPLYKAAMRTGSPFAVSLYLHIACRRAERKKRNEA